MSTLLEEIIDAHGGLQTWCSLTDLVTRFEIDGNVCAQATPMEFSVAQAFFSLRHPYIIMTDQQGGPILMIDSDQIKVGESQDHSDPLFALETFALDASRQTHHMRKASYSLARALRHYVTAPFLYASPGFVTEEIDPWNESGETWRVLKVTFPPHIEAPARTQYAYYGADRFLRRTRYHLDTSPLQEFVNYAHCYDRVDGIWLPTTREILGCDPRGHKIPDQHYASVHFVRPFFT